MEAEERPNKKRRLSAGEPMDRSPAAPVYEGSAGLDIVTNGSKNGEGERSNVDLDVTRPNGDLVKEIDDPLPLSNGDPPRATEAPFQQGDLDNDPAFAALSKNQQKKLRKKQEWEAKHEERKQWRKGKLIAKRERRRQERENYEELLASGLIKPKSPPPEKRPKPQKAVTLPVTIMIDCNFDDLMKDNERVSLAAQVTRSYSDDRKAMFRAHLAVCSFTGKLRERFDTVLTHYQGWRGVKFLDCGFVEAAEEAKKWMSDEKYGGKLAGAFSACVFPNHGSDEADAQAVAKLKEDAEVVYLTSESPNTLTMLKPYSTYIIGGLVDKNREKGICYKRAVDAGVKTAKLPIGEFMEMQSRKVLATNHVNEICVKWLECGDWGEAFLKVIPKRKGGKLKGDHGEQAVETEEDDDGEDADVVTNDVEEVEDAEIATDVA